MKSSPLRLCSGVQVSPVRGSASVQGGWILSGSQAGTRSLHGQREEAGRERGSSGPRPPVLGGHQCQVDTNTSETTTKPKLCETESSTRLGLGQFHQCT